MQTLEHIATPFSILSGEELKDKMSNTIGETLSEELGVTASDFGQGASRPIIRGLGGPRLQVMQGGISSMDVSTISVDHNVSLSPFNADQIEILRGPAALLYGNGASAGVVNIVNNRIPEYLGEFETEMNYQYNTALEGNSFAGKVNGSTGNLAFHADLMNLRTLNYEAEVGEILNSDIDTTDVNFGASFIDDWGFLGFSVGRYDSTYGLGFNPEEPDEQVFIDLNQTRVDFAGQLNNPLPWLNNIRLRGANNDYGHTEFEGPGEPGTVFFNDEWEGRLEANHKAFGPWSGVVGVQARTRSFAAVGEEAFVAPTKLTSVGLF
ncbi:MAG: TonB-dependent receptor plug domain-containing protein, partial [Thiotrichales bacterium]|nr:TonB-dependent receptor plug domain-containing protein [Thiotrichales bacterium]